jgi:recombination protein RecT
MTTKTTDVATREEGQAPDRRPQSVLQVFDSPSFKAQIAAALPKHITPESMMRIALTEVRMNPDLQKCTVPSFMGAMLKAAQSGLRPGMFGEGWILARWNSKLSSYEAQFQPGYMGLAQLAYRSSEVSEIATAAVYKADHFKYQLGSERRIEHVPDLEAVHKDEDIVAFYAVIKLVNGGILMEVMARRDVDYIRDTYGPHTKAGKLVGPWVGSYEAMGRKTALIQALKLAPKESERLQFALAAESDALFGDRLAAGAVDVPQTAAERVAQKLGADEPTTDENGEVIDAEADEQFGFDDGPEGGE